jgi:hypothetical protein
MEANMKKMMEAKFKQMQESIVTMGSNTMINNGPVTISTGAIYNGPVNNITLNLYKDVSSENYPPIMYTEDMKNKLIDIAKNDPINAIVEYNKEKFRSPERPEDQCIKITPEDLLNDEISVLDKKNEWGKKNFSEDFMTRTLYSSAVYYYKILKDLKTFIESESDITNIKKIIQKISVLFCENNIKELNEYEDLKTKFIEILSTIKS